MNEQDFLAIARFVKESTGITLPEAQEPAVREHLEKSLQRKGLSGEGYCVHLQQDRAEFDELMQIVTINETYFFREEKQFRFLADILIPELKSRSPGEEINIWSASCSSGEEPLSLYALFLALMPPKSFRVFGSDISRVVLDKFERGLYRHSAFREDGKSFHSYIKGLADCAAPPHCTIPPAHIRAIQKSKINLFRDSLDGLPPMDLIFLRNTLIYMSPDNKTVAIDRIAGKLKEGGILMLSASEIPVISHPALSVVSRGNIYYFQKQNPLTLTPEGLKENVRQAVLQKVQARSAVPPVPKKATPVQKRERENPFSVHLTEEQVCRSIAMMLNNKLYKPVLSEEERLARFILTLMGELEENRTDRALELIEKEKKIPPSLEFYLRGYSYYQREEKETARKNFQRALNFNDRLWPARYYLIKTLDGDSPDRGDLLRDLEEQIEEYIRSHRYDYQFLLDGFNAQYFLLIVRDMQKSRTMERRAFNGT